MRAGSLHVERSIVEEKILPHHFEPEKSQAKTQIGFVLVMELFLDQWLVQLDWGLKKEGQKRQGYNLDRTHQDDFTGLEEAILILTKEELHSRQII